MSKTKIAFGKVVVVNGVRDAVRAAARYRKHGCGGLMPGEPGFVDAVIARLRESRHLADPIPGETMAAVMAVLEGA